MVSKNKYLVLHTVVNTFTAKNFVEPFLLSLDQGKYNAELVVDDFGGKRKFLEELDVNLKEERFALSINIIDILKKTISLKKLFSEIDPDVVHSHLSTGAVIPLLAARLSKVPIRIYHNHGVPYIGHTGIARIALMLIEYINCRLATHVITVSPGMIKPLKRVTKKNINIFGKGSACGLPDSSYSRNKTFAPVLNNIQGINKNSFVFLYVGRPFKRKGFNLMVESFMAAFPSKVTNAHLLIAGCNRNELHEIVDEVPHNIHALGVVTDMKSLYQFAKVVVLPSYHEGFGYALLEGAAAKCALISSNIPGPDSIVVPGLTGDVFKVGDSFDLINLLQNFYLNPELVSKYSENAYIEACKYKRTDILPPYSDFMEEVLK